MPLKINVTGKSDVGLVRSGNEDYLHIDKNNFVVAVCDGMGGHKAGDVASMTAAETINSVFNSWRREIREDNRLKIDKTLPVRGDILLRAIRLANRAICHRASSNSGLSGMGTTVVALAFEKDTASVLHVGDSRAYRIGEEKLIPLTRDHSWVAEIQANQSISAEEAESMVGKNVITRALGVRDTVEVDVSVIKVKPGEKFLLCSDGLCGYAEDDEIFRALYSHRDDNDKIVDNLVQMANDRGGADNVTVIVVEILEVEESAYSPISAITITEEKGDTITAQNEWLEKINNAAEKKNDALNPDESTSSGKSGLILIFLAFIVIAVILIWQFTGK